METNDKEDVGLAEIQQEAGEPTNTEAASTSGGRTGIRCSFAASEEIKCLGFKSKQYFSFRQL